MQRRSPLRKAPAISSPGHRCHREPSSSAAFFQAMSRTLNLGLASRRSKLFLARWGSSVMIGASSLDAQGSRAKVLAEGFLPAL